MADTTVQNLKEVIERGAKEFDIATEIIEGQVAQDVVVSDGTTRPNWTKRVSQLLNDVEVYNSSSIGSSASAEGQYFGVGTVDSDGVITYDLYQKKNGKAVLRLSGMKSSGGSVSLDSGGEYSLKTMANMNLVSGVRNWNSMNQSPGNVKSDNFTVTELIPVKRGQCFFLGYTGDWGAGVDNYVAFYDTDSNPVGSLVYTRFGEPKSNGISNIIPNYNSESRLRKRYFRVPRDGFIRLSAATNAINNFHLGEVSFEKFIKDQYSTVAQLNFKEIDALGYAFSPIYTLLGGHYENSSGDSWQKEEFANHAASELIPVKKGQFLSYIIGAYSGLTIGYVYNSYKQITGTISDFNTVASVHDGSRVLRSSSNYQIQQDGYIQMATDIAVDSLTDQALVWISDEFYDLRLPFTEHQYDVEKINGYQNTSNVGATYVRNEAFDTFMPIYMSVDTYIRVDVCATNDTGTNFNAVQVSNQIEQNIVSNYLYFSGMSEFTSDQMPELGKTYSVFIYADRSPLSVNVNTASGTGGVYVLTREEWIEQRNEYVSQLVPQVGVWGSNPGLNGDPTNSANAGVGYIPVLPDEIVIARGNSLKVRHFSYLHDPKWTEFFAITEDFRYRMQRQVAGDLTSKNLAMIAWRNLDRFGYFSYTIDAGQEGTGGPNNDGSWVDNFFKGNEIKIISKEEIESKYIDNEKFPQDYSVDSFIKTQWSDSDTCLTRGRDTTTYSNHNFRELFPIAIQKGECYHWKMNIGTAGLARTPFVVYFDDEDYTKMIYKALCDVGPQPRSDTVSPQPMEGYFKAEHSGFIYLQSRRQGGNESDNDQDQRLYDIHKQLECYRVSDEVYHQMTDITFDEDVMYLDDSGIEFHMINGPMPYDLNGYTYEYPCQVWKSGKHLTTFLLITGVQGQSTAGAGYRKKNIDVKGRNKKGKKIVFKVGDWKETKKLALKANLQERTGLRDLIGNRLWRETRRFGYEYPNNQIGYRRLFDYSLIDYPDLRFINDADYSMRSSMSSVFYGGMYYGLYQLRTKKDEQNYGIIENDSNFIWLQSDYRAYSDAHGGEQNKVDFDNFTYKAWEVTQPESALPKNYEVGDEPTDSKVNSAIHRFFDLIQNSSPGDKFFDDESEKCMNIDSFIDYYIHAEVVLGWDNSRNNIILTCQNAKDDDPVWTIHFYDMDNTFGANSNTPYDDVTREGNSEYNKWGTLMMASDKYRPMIENRYKFLRDSGPLQINEIMKLIDDAKRLVADTWETKNADSWGDSFKNSTQYIKNWLVKRFEWMDKKFNYGD